MSTNEITKGCPDNILVKNLVKIVNKKKYILKFYFELFGNIEAATSVISLYDDTLSRSRATLFVIFLSWLLFGVWQRDS